MIRRSDNDRADAVYARVGDAGLLRVARLARMRHFAVAGYWASAQITALDQARLFLRVDRLVPERNRAYARRLLASIVSYSAGASRAMPRAPATPPSSRAAGGHRAGPAGARGGPVRARAARGSPWRCSRDGNRSHDYGTATLRGVAARIFATAARPRARAPPPPGRPARGGPRDLLDTAPGIRVELAYGRDAQPHRAAGCPATAGPGPTCWAQPPWIWRGCSAGCAGADTAFWCSMLTALPARRGRSCTGRGGGGRPELVGTYIARRSRHNTGGAVDLTLVRLRDGRRLRMGTGYDHLGPRAHTLAARAGSCATGSFSKAAMERHGFSGYWREWWHFEHRVQARRQLDLTLGCPGPHPR